MDVVTAMSNRLRLLAAVLGVCAATAGQAQGNAWPQRPVKLVVPFPAGGNVDAYARVFAPALSKEIGQPVVIENRAGATGAIGVKEVARAEPDGYTVLMGNITSVVGTTVLNKEARLSPLEQLMPVCTLADNEIVLFANAKTGATTLADLKRLSTADRPLTFGSSGNGSISHLAMVQLMLSQNVDASHIPYKGNGPFTVDLVAGHIQLGMVDLNNAAQYIKSGALVPLAVTGQARLAELPNIPSTGELGLKRPNFTAWIGLLLPTATPQAIAKALADASARAIRAPAVVAFTSHNGNRSAYRDAAEMRQLISDGIQDWSEFINSKIMETAQ